MKPTKEQQLVSTNLDIAVKMAGRFAAKQPYIPYEDLLSLCLESLCLASNKCNDPSKYRMHARRVARCDVLNYLEKTNLRRQTVVPSSYDEEDEEGGEQCLGPVDTTSPEDIAMVRQYVASLPVRDQEIIQLSYEGYTDAEIGTRLAPPVDRQVVKRRLMAIRRNFPI